MPCGGWLAAFRSRCAHRRGHLPLLRPFMGLRFSHGGLFEEGAVPLLSAVHPRARHQFLVGVGRCRHVPAPIWQSSSGETASWGVYAAGFAWAFSLASSSTKGPLHAVVGSGTRRGSPPPCFGFIHISNPNETWIGIFAAAFIGFVFCVSVRVPARPGGPSAAMPPGTGRRPISTAPPIADSVRKASYLTSSPAGNPLWSGGAVGPEGSLLVLGAVLFLLVLILVYGRLASRRARLYYADGARVRRVHRPVAQFGRSSDKSWIAGVGIAALLASLSWRWRLSMAWPRR